MMIVTLHFYMRSHIGQKTWRSFHYVSFLTYLIALLQGITAGSDTSLPWAQQYYWISGGTLLFLLSYHIVANISTKLALSSTRCPMTCPGIQLTLLPHTLKIKTGGNLTGSDCSNLREPSCSGTNKSQRHLLQTMTRDPSPYPLAK